jgi:DNA-binding NarL/FixJ family response regulator
MTIRLLIADDHELVREGLRSAFNDTEIQVTGEATTGDEAAELALDRDVDAVLLDINLPGKDGFQVLRQVKSEKPELPVLIYSQHDRPDFKRRARELTASGYVVKGIHKTELLEAVRRVSRGETLWNASDGNGHHK